GSVSVSSTVDDLIVENLAADDMLFWKTGVSNIIPDRQRFLQEKNFQWEFFLERILVQCSGP
ncbi:MAG: hypothetical protein WAO10_15450, partial [Candidatus Sulfotelmatobacter sp.]